MTGALGTAVITGGTRGIGLAAAEALAERGYAIAIAGGRDRAALDAALERIRAKGAEVSGALLDVRDAAAVDEWVRAAEAELGPVTVGIASAGNIRLQPFLTMPVEDWDLTMDTHVRGTFALCQSAARLMADAGRSGSLITLTSFGGVKAAGAGLADYSAAKGAIVALTRTLAKELLPQGIRVNCILPAAETRMTESLRDYWHLPAEAMGRNVLGGVYAEASDVAPAFVFLAGEDARWVTGQIIAVDGGFGL